MNNDIVDVLRDTAFEVDSTVPFWLKNAADEIERLRKLLWQYSEMCVHLFDKGAADKTCETCRPMYSDEFWSVEL